MGKKNSNKGNGGMQIHRVGSYNEFQKINRQLNNRGYVAIDALKPGLVRTLTLGDSADKGATQMAAGMGCGSWSNGPLSKVAWSFDSRDNAVHPVTDKDTGKPLGLGYVDWGPGNSTPSVIPPLAQSLPYTASPLRYLADLTAGLGPKLMYAFDDDTLCEYKKAGYRILERIEQIKKNQPEDTFAGELAKNPQTGAIVPIEEISEKDRPDPIMRGLGLDFWKDAYREWERTWLGYDEEDEMGDTEHIPGAKEFLEENNLDMQMAQCMQDNVMLDIYFPTVGLQRGRARRWGKPRVVRVGVIPSHSIRLEKQGTYGHIDHCYVSDSFRTTGFGVHTVTDPEQQKIKMYPACMPQQLLSDLRYIVEDNQRTRIKARPTWIVCPTYYPSLNKPYYPQPAWWSIFSSKAFDFASTILYDKYKQRDNATSWGKILYISLDYLNLAYGDLGIEGDKEAQEKFLDELDNNVEKFLQQRENNGKMMRQFMWSGQGDKTFKNVEIVDVKETTSDGVKAGKEELELSTSPIFLALGVDPRLVGVPMVAASNGGTALREMHLLKQQQLSIHQRLYLQWLQSVTVIWNGWDHAQWVIKQMTLSTLDRSSTGLVTTIANEEGA